MVANAGVVARGASARDGGTSVMEGELNSYHIALIVQKSLISANVETWEKCWEVNIRGTLLCYKYAARQMVKQGGGGRIIGTVFIGEFSGDLRPFSRCFFSLWIERCA
jgi:NAD(P)-dependent dehydrogenase (short-subunit alcohol dehydrogenase family)